MEESVGLGSAFARQPCCPLQLRCMHSQDTPRFQMRRRKPESLGQEHIMLTSL